MHHWACLQREALAVYRTGCESDRSFQAKDPFVAELAAAIVSVAVVVSAIASDEHRSQTAQAWKKSCTPLNRAWEVVDLLELGLRKRPDYRQELDFDARVEHESTDTNEISSHHMLKA